MTKKMTKELPKTTAGQLGSIIKSCRDIMRKDKGLNGDLDRLPMITWIMFLKFLDDMERIRETESEIKKGVESQAFIVLLGWVKLDLPVDLSTMTYIYDDD